MKKFDLKEIFQIFWNKKWHISAIIMVSVIIGFLYSFKVVQPSYKSSTTLILGRKNVSQLIGPVKFEETQSEKTENLLSTYTELIKSESFIKEVIQNLDINLPIEKIRSGISIKKIEDTELLEITVINLEPDLTSGLANEIAKVFGEKVENIYNLSSTYIVDRAIPSAKPYNVNHKRDIIISAIIGIVLSVIYAIIFKILDNTLKTSKDIEKTLNVKNLISILYSNNELKLLDYKDDKSSFSQMFTSLRSNIQFSDMGDKKSKTYLITSCFKGEGKSYIAANLAIAFVQAGKNVVIVDSDMRNGKQAEIFNVSNENGLSNYIFGIDCNGKEINYGVTKFIKETNIKKLNIITSGSMPPNPSKLLESEKVYDLIKDLKAYYDIVIFDGTFIFSQMDALILAGLIDSTILVARYNKTKKADIRRAKVDIEDVGGTVIGTCLNFLNEEEVSKLKYYIEKIKLVLKNIVKKFIKLLKNNKIKRLKTGDIPKLEIKNSNLLEAPIDTSIEEGVEDEVEIYTFEDAIVPNELRGKEEIMIAKQEEEKRQKMEELMNEKRKLDEKRRIEQVKFAKQKREEEEAKKEELRVEQERKQEQLRLEEQRKQEEIFKEKIKLERQKREDAERALEQLKLEVQKREAKLQEQLRIEKELLEGETKLQEQFKLEQEKKAEEIKILEEKRKIEEEKRQKEENRREQLRIKQQKLEGKSNLKIMKAEEKINHNEIRKQKIDDMRKFLTKSKSAIKEKRRKETRNKKKRRELEEEKILAEIMEQQDNSKYFGKKIMFEIDCDDTDI